MSYFAAAIACLLIGLALMGSGFGLPAAEVGTPDTLVVVHVVVLGWLGLLFCGALLQFVPVLASTTLRLSWLAAPALAAVLAGLTCLVGGFLALGGHLDLDPALMLAGAVLLVTALVGLSTSFAATLLSQKAVDHSGRLVLLGLAALLVTVGLGSTFAGVLSGIIDGNWSVDLLAFGIPVHAASGIAGWMTLTAVGVSYRLFSMFMLAPEGGFSTRGLVAAAVAALAALWGGLVLSFFLSAAATVSGLLVTGLFALATLLYLSDLRNMYRVRRRKMLELNIVAGLWSAAYLVVGLALFAVDVVTEGDPAFVPAAFYALAMGWLSGLGLAQLYKIVPFLTWLEAYGPVMGRSSVPRVQDLVMESRARLWFIVYHAAVSVGIASLLLDAHIGFRAAAWGQFTAVIALAIEYARARRLSYAPDPVRLPEGAIRPHLIYANQN
jgi:hypothetical protein